MRRLTLLALASLFLVAAPVGQAKLVPAKAETTSSVAVNVQLAQCQPPTTTGKPSKAKPPFKACSGNGMTTVGSFGQQHWSLSVQPTATTFRGTLTLGRGGNHVVLGLSASLNGDWNGDGVIGVGTYTVRGGNGALKRAFTSAPSKQVRVTGKLGYTGLELRLEFSDVSGLG